MTFPSTLATPPAPLPLELRAERPVMPRWPNGQGHLATNQESAGSTPARGARRSVAQRQSIGPTNRGAGVRVPPDRRWSWCSGTAFLTVTQAAPVRLRVITPCQMWVTAAQSPVKRRLRHPPSDSGIWLRAPGGGLLRRVLLSWCNGWARRVPNSQAAGSTPAESTLAVWPS